MLLAGLLTLLILPACGELPGSSSSTVSPPTTADLNDGSKDAAAQAPIGYVGCSVTLDAVRGYRRLEGSRLWAPDDLAYGLGTISAWADPDPANDYWADFSAMLEARPETAAIWWQLCAGQGPDDTLDGALKVLERLSLLAPGVPVYVSAQPGYSTGHLCPIAGYDGPAQMQTIADQLVDDPRVMRGPALDPLSTDDLRDNCHADRRGQALQGEQLIAFFEILEEGP